MISKIHNIRGVGRFKNFESKQGIVLGDLTLIYSENGQGKSTLADILRSLSKGDESRLHGRKTVGATDQFIKFETEDGIRCFHNGSWNDTLSDILIFDEIFINDNIYEGLSVRPEQRENLHPVIVGEVQKRGVQKEEALVAERTQINNSQREIKKRIESAINGIVRESDLRLELDEFVRLKSVEDIDTRIKEKQAEVDQLNNSDQIHRQSKLKNIDVPVLPIDEVRQLLEKKLSGVADDAKEALQDHIECFSGDSMRSWIQQGAQYQSETDDICPYCGQSLAGSELIEQYQAIFENKYEAFETEVSTFSSRKMDIAQWITQIRSIVDSNCAWTTFWKQHIPVLQVPDLNVNKIEQILSKAKAEFDAVLNLKKDSLFKPIPFNPTLDAAIASWNSESQSVENYQVIIEGINRRIDALRAKTQAGDLTVAKRELAVLRYTELRYRDEVANDCDLYAKKGQDLELLNRKLTKQREENSQAIKNTFEKYEKSLDRYLKGFGASFRIKDLIETRVRGVLRADYKISLSEVETTLGKPDSISQRSFRNMLSEGDKRSLAMAFFLSRIDQMTDLEDKIVVFDDPVTSMDDNRRNRTILEIGRLAKQSKKIIVLSHRPEFLHSLWYRFCRHGGGQIWSTQLEIRSVKNSSTLLPWNMEATVASLHAKRIRRVLEYYYDDSDKEVDEISGELRPLLDYHYKIHYPELFELHNISTIGDFARMLDPNSPDPVVKVLAATDKTYLADLNIVHRETMHGQDPPPEPPGQSHIKGFAG
ncbi:MAG: AAA family ATPase [Chloroflexota bacterium]|nr:AAA family ATPase [Chloroflexota bacterium]